MSFDSEFSKKEFIQRENNIIHAPFGEEFSFYEYVKSGDVDKITNHLQNSNLKGKEGFGKLSNDKVRDIRYHFVITVALIARYCIEGGMHHQVAYSLSDFYIQKADNLNSVEQISELHKIMTIDYTKKMKLLKKNTICSKPIVMLIDYIYNNIHTRITHVELAKFVDLNPCYLSKLFKKEMGLTISEYIQRKKIEVAQNMLKYSQYSASEISSILAFPTQSYFTEVFKKYVGMTPKKYCEKYFRDISLNTQFIDKSSYK